MSPAKILAVDDEPDIELLLTQRFRRQIREREFDFRFARHGEEALAVLGAEPDIVLMLLDINMPVMDGLTLLARLREQHSPVQTIIVSAYGDMPNLRTAMNRGAFDFLTKPIDFPDLEATVAKTIQHIEFLREAQRRQLAAERAHASLSRYFSPNLAERLSSETDAIDLRGQRREIASLFTDIAGFTGLVETLEPGVLGPLLNEYLTGMTDIVFAHDGTLAKIVGDALHVLFGAPGEQPDHATRAIACALSLDAYAQSFRDRRNREGIALVVTRIGVHAGPAIVGNFGGGRFFDYTAYGDTINTAARLEAANKQLGTCICASAAVAAQAEGFRGRPIGDLVLRGRIEPIKAVEPLRPEQYGDPANEAYLRAFALLEAADPQALTAFAAHVSSQPNDRLASFHLKRLLNGVTGTRIAME